MGIKIIGNGHFVPPTTLTNEQLEQFVETNDEWITTRTGIKNRHICAEEDTVQLAYEAGRRALKSSKISPEEIDLVIVATFTPQYLTPSTACLVAAKLGIDTGKVMAFDLNAACTGFVYALTVAAQFIENNKHQKALIIGAEVISKVVDWTDRNTCVLFGDGAGAVVVSYDETPYYSYLNAKGDESLVLATTCIPRNTPHHLQTLSPIHLHMNGQEVFKFAVTAIKDTISSLLEQSQLTIEDINLMIPHQANKRIISKVQRDFKISEDKFYLNLEQYGNTSAASIPIALSEAIETGKLHKQDQVLLVGFGGGLTWGGCLITLAD